MQQLKLLNFLIMFIVIASSGAVDEDSFDRSFDQVPIVNVSVCLCVCVCESIF